MDPERYSEAPRFTLSKLESLTAEGTVAGASYATLDQKTFARMVQTLGYGNVTRVAENYDPCLGDVVGNVSGVYYVQCLSSEAVRREGAIGR